MKIEKVIRRRIRRAGNGVEVAGDVNAAIAGNVGGRGSSTARVSSTQRVEQQTKSTPPRRKED